MDMTQPELTHHSGQLGEHGDRAHTPAPHRDSISSGILIGRPFGIALIADYSLLLIMFLVALNLATGVLPSWHPDWSTGMRWGVASVAALTLIASIAVHELAHALVARRHDTPIRRVTLFLFGGMAHMEREPASPRAEFWISVVGPLTSLGIGIGSIALGGLLLRNADEFANNPMQAMAHASALVSVLLWIGPINVMLAVFNLLPGFPLDGGRVLRAVLWAITKDLRKATRMASLCGQALAWLLMACGVVMALGQRVPWFGSGVGSGIWLVLIGWFLNRAARLSFEQLLLRQSLQHVPLREVMRSHILSVPPQISIARFVEEYVIESDDRAFPVAQEGILLGLIRPRDVHMIARDDWPTVRVREVMLPLSKLRTLTPDVPASDALESLAEQDPIPVVENDHLVGVARREDVMRWLAWNSRHA